MKKVFILTLFLFVLDSAIWACPNCVISLINLYLPFLWPAVVLLVCWAIVYIVLKISAISKTSSRIINLSFVFTLFFLVGYSYIYQSRLDTIERIKKYVLRGTGPERQLIEKIAADPGFDIQILVPMIRKHGTRDEELAFHILYRRKIPGDLNDLKDLILDHPGLEKALSEDKWVDQMYFYFWLRSLGVDDTIKNKSDLMDWIEKKPPPGES